MKQLLIIRRSLLPTRKEMLFSGLLLVLLVLRVLRKELLFGEKAESIGVKEAEVIVKGVGTGRESAIRAFMSRGIEIASIRDKTPIPFNGPRPPKPRRV